MALAVIGGLVTLLFAVAFFTRRRFGILGLGLATGSVIAQNGSGIIAGLMEHYRLETFGMAYPVVATILLIMLPVIILLAGGPRYSNKKTAAIAAGGFALLGLIFVFGPLSSLLSFQDQFTREAAVLITKWQWLIVIAGLAIALFDVLQIHTSAAKVEGKK